MDTQRSDGNARRVGDDARRAGDDARRAGGDAVRLTPESGGLQKVMTTFVSSTTRLVCDGLTRQLDQQARDQPPPEPEPEPEPDPAPEP